MDSSFYTIRLNLLLKNNNFLYTVQNDLPLYVIRVVNLGVNESSCIYTTFCTVTKSSILLKLFSCEQKNEFTGTCFFSKCTGTCLGWITEFSIFYLIYLLYTKSPLNFLESLLNFLESLLNRHVAFLQILLGRHMTLFNLTINFHLN